MRTTLVFVSPVLDHEARPFRPTLPLQQVVRVEPPEQRSGDVGYCLQLVYRADCVAKAGSLRLSYISRKIHKLVDQGDEDEYHEDSSNEPHLESAIQYARGKHNNIDGNNGDNDQSQHTFSTSAVGLHRGLRIVQTELGWLVCIPLRIVCTWSLAVLVGDSCHLRNRIRARQPLLRLIGVRSKLRTSEIRRLPFACSGKLFGEHAVRAP